MEDGYAVNHAPFSFLAWRKIIFLPVVYEDEAAAVLEVVVSNRESKEGRGHVLAEAHPTLRLFLVLVVRSRVCSPRT